MQAPSVYAAGFFNASVESSSPFEFGVQAYVLDPDGLRDVRDVEICYGGIGLGKFLLDDGRGADAAAGDSIFTFSEAYLPNSLPQGLYRLELVATDMAGNRSVTWPYMDVVFEPFRLMAEPPRLTPRGEQIVGASGDGPVIIGGGYFGNEVVKAGSLMRLMVLVSDPDGYDDIDRVELFFEGGGTTGYLLNDDGIEGDAHAGDGTYTMQTFVPMFLAGEKLLLEVVAYDQAGNASATYPYFEVL